MPIEGVPGYPVTPFTGVWIEMSPVWANQRRVPAVTPFTGVWIEITLDRLKPIAAPVTPFTGVWIEITTATT